jgi:uncharacterized protein (TIGR02265 family)
MRSSAPLDLVGPHCDIEERLQSVSPAARVRGLYFRSLESSLKQLGHWDRYQDLFPEERWSSMGLYPLAPYMLRLACAGALVASPERVHHGMHELLRSNATIFASSLLGKTMLRLLARDPVRLAEQGLAARRLTHLYGHWEMARCGPRCIEMIYCEEYVWIESAVAGAARGTFEACGLEPSLETRLKDRFNGSTVIRW